MNKLFNLKTVTAVAAMLVLSAAHAENMSSNDSAYKAAKSRVSAEYRADKAACATLASDGKDSCIEQAMARKKLARADLRQVYAARPG